MLMPTARLILLSLIFAGGFIQAHVAAQDFEGEPSASDSASQELSYQVDLTDSKRHYIHVTLNAVADSEETELMMAVWTPGSYLVREYARHLDSLEIVDADQEPLPWRKTRKNRWRVATEPGKPFTVRYRLYCNEPTVRTNFAGHRFAVLNGAPTFLTVPQRRQTPHRVSIVLPKDWKRTVTALPIADRAHEYVAASFDELVDCPIVAGSIDIYPFDVDGVPHQLVNVGETGYWNGEAAASDLAKIVSQHRKLWGSLPYDRYLFLNVICERGGGLEHDTSTLLMTSRWAYRVPDRYEGWLSLASHEHFHAWNVRRLRPKPLMKYDYESEIYTDSLWIAEGITSYYEDIALVRVGLIDHSDFLKRQSKNIERVEQANGRRVQSLRDASFDTWIKFYRPDENSSNTRVSYYSKGAIVAFLLDAKIREITDGTKSLDDVMRKVYDRFQSAGYTESQFRKTASEVAGVDLDDWFASAIDSTDDLDYQPALDYFGLKFKGEDPKTDTDEESTGDETETESDSEDAKPTLGIELSGGKVQRVREDGPASAAGINTADELLAINGFRLQSSLTDHLKQFSVGDQVDLTLARSGQILQINVPLVAEPEKSWKLVKRKPKKDDSEESDKSESQTAIQSERIAAWLGEEPSTTEQDDAADSSESESKDDA